MTASINIKMPPISGTSVTCFTLPKTAGTLSTDKVFVYIPEQTVGSIRKTGELVVKAISTVNPASYLCEEGIKTAKRIVVLEFNGDDSVNIAISKNFSFYQMIAKRIVLQDGELGKIKLGEIHIQKKMSDKEYDAVNTFYDVYLKACEDLKADTSAAAKS